MRQAETHQEYRGKVRADMMRFEPRRKAGRFAVVRLFLMSGGFRAVFCYRAISYRLSRGSKWRAYFFILIRQLSTSIHISHNARIGKGLLVPHPQCIVIGPAEIGNNVTIEQGVTVGANIDKQTSDGRTNPIIGDSVLLAAGCKVIGPVVVGANTIVGANAVVISDIPPDSVAVGVPARRVKKNDRPYPLRLNSLTQLRT